MQLAGISDLFEIVVLIIVFAGPAIVKFFSGKKEDTPEAPDDEYTASQADLDSWLQSLTGETKPATPAPPKKVLKKKRGLKKTTAQEKVVHNPAHDSSPAPKQQSQPQEYQQTYQQTKAPEHRAPVQFSPESMPTQPASSKQPVSSPPSTATNESTTSPAITPPLQRASKRTTKRKNNNAPTTIRTLLRGGSRKNAIILSEILGKPPGLR